MVLDNCKNYTDGDNQLGNINSNLTLIGIIFKNVSNLYKFLEQIY